MKTLRNITFIAASLLLISGFRNAFSAGFSGDQQQKKVKITGIVTDVNMNPIEGVRIFVDQANTNSISNSKGYYRIKVSPEAKQISAFSGRYGIQKIAIMSDLGAVREAVINIRLVDITAGILDSAQTGGEMISAPESKDEEMINVGFGTISRKNVNTEVNKISGQKSYQSYSSVYDMIRGEVPGVEVVGKTIRIRDAFSFYLNTDPLLLVDGMVIPDLDAIVPADVKSIEVLKGASASVYGSRGANGVILITTMKGGDKK